MVNALILLAAITVDAAFPGGNVKVDAIDEHAGIVRLRPDSGERGEWFYTYFRVRGAQGRSLKFEFEPGTERLTKVGPAVSSDDGRTWRFLNAETADAEPSSFSYAFGPDESAVRFSIGIPYTQGDWRAFVDGLSGNPRLRESALCPSQDGTRTNELLRISGVDDAHAPYVLLFTCRHHACEMSASRVMEGVIEGFLADTPEAQWARRNCVGLFVPFVDKDGVERGDQGKRRKPHDHNQDYLAGTYTSIRAIRDLVRSESKGRRFHFLDMHAPWIRGAEHDHYYFLLSQNPKHDAMSEAFNRALVETQRGGKLVYEPCWNIPGGAPWNNSTDYEKKGLLMSHAWMGREPNCINAFCGEFGYGLMGGVYTPAAARELGRNIFRAIVRTLRLPDPQRP